MGAPQEQLPDLVAFAQEHTVEETAAAARAAKGKEASPRRRVTFSFFQDQAEFVDAALETAKELTGRDNPAQALEMVVGEWLMLKAQPIPLDAALRVMEARYGVRLAVTGEQEVADADVQVP